MPIGSPLILGATVNAALLVPENADPPFIFSHTTVDVAVQLSVPVPVFMTVTDWLPGVTPFCTAENESEAGLYPIVGVAGADVTVDVVGEMSCVRPGMAVVSLCVPRPPPEVLPWVDGAANPERVEEGEDAEPVPVDTAPARLSDVVVVEVGFDGVRAVVPLGAKTPLVESLLGTVVPSIEVVVVFPLVDDACVVGASTRAVADRDFLINLCGLRNGISFAEARLFVLVRGSLSWLEALS